ncbi:MAG: methionyl-tRNA formyltransferase, partial [Bdellovibrionales bacterium]
CRRPDHTLKIHRAQLAAGAQGSAGEVVRIDGPSFTVACERQGLEIFEVQPESRARLNVADYLKGYPLQVGDMLL